MLLLSRINQTFPLDLHSVLNLSTHCRMQSLHKLGFVVVKFYINWIKTIQSRPWSKFSWLDQNKCSPIKNTMYSKNHVVQNLPLSTIIVSKTFRCISSQFLCHESLFVHKIHVLETMCLKIIYESKWKCLCTHLFLFYSIFFLGTHHATLSLFEFQFKTEWIRRLCCYGVSLW